MAEPSQSAAPTPAQGTVPNAAAGTAPAQAPQPPNPIGGANIQNQAVNPEAVKLEIARRLLQTHLGGASANNDGVRAAPLGINLPPGVTINPSPPVSQDHPQLNIQPSAFQPTASPPSSTTPQSSYQPFSGNAAPQSSPQSAATSTISSGFFATSPSHSTTSTPASSPAQPSPAQQSQSTPGYVSSPSSSQTQQATPQPASPTSTSNQPASNQAPSTQQTSQNQNLSPQQPSPISSLVSPPTGSLSSASHAAYIQSILASMNQQGSMAQIHAVLIQTPAAPVAPLTLQTVQIQPSTPSSAFQSAPLLQGSSVSNQSTSAVSPQPSNRDAAPVEPIQRAATPAEQTPRGEQPIRPPAQQISAEVEAILRAITGQPTGAPPAIAPTIQERSPQPPHSPPPLTSPQQPPEHASSPTSQSREATPATTVAPTQPPTSINPPTQPPAAINSPAQQPPPPPPSSPPQQLQPANPIAPPNATLNNESRPDLRPDPNQSPRQQELPIQPNPSLRETLITIPSPQRPIAEIVIQPLPYKPEQQNTTAQIPAPQSPASQEHANQVQQRIERLRDIQQIIAAERDPSKPILEQIVRDAGPRTSVRQEQTTNTVERVRESIIDRLTTIQSRIEAASTERQRLDDVRGPRDTRIQGRDTLIRPDPIHHDAKPSLITKLAERLHENQGDARVMRDSITGLASATAIERVRVRHIDSTSPLVGSRATSITQPLSRMNHEPEKLSNLIDLLKRFSERSVNFTLLNKMDTSLEKACLTIVTGAALGYLGLEIVYRASTLVVLHTLASLRDEEQPEPDATSDDDQENLEQQLVEDLEEFTTAELSTVGEQGFVVDLAGIVVAAHSGEPLAHVEVNCSEFGSCHTDSEGRFLFANIPLGTPYTISVSSNHLNLKPLVITGVCGELEFLTIRVQVA